MVTPARFAVRVQTVTVDGPVVVLLVHQPVADHGEPGGVRGVRALLGVEVVPGIDAALPLEPHFPRARRVQIVLDLEAHVAGEGLGALPNQQVMVGDLEDLVGDVGGSPHSPRSPQPRRHAGSVRACSTSPVEPPRPRSGGRRNRRSRPRGRVRRCSLRQSGSRECPCPRSSCGKRVPRRPRPRRFCSGSRSPRKSPPASGLTIGRRALLTPPRRVRPRRRRRPGRTAGG